MWPYRCEYLSTQLNLHIYTLNRYASYGIHYTIDYFNILQSQNKLHENEMLLVSNKKKHKPNENVYVQAQNIYIFPSLKL